MTTLLEDILFEKSEVAAESVSITKEMVVGQLSEIVQDQDLSRYIL